MSIAVNHEIFVITGDEEKNIHVVFYIQFLLFSKISFLSTFLCAINCSYTSYTFFTMWFSF